MTSPTPDQLLDAIRRLPRDTTVVIEGNAKLAESLHGHGFHVVLVGAQSETVLAVPSAAALNDTWSAITCRNHSVATIGTPALQAVVAQAAERTRVNVATSNYRARGWAENFIRNLRHLAKPLAMTLQGLDGVPAFIVGAGSSLDLNHHLLPEASRRGIVIAVNAAARLPGVDMALTVESNDLRHKFGSLDHVAFRAFGSTADTAVMAHGSGALVPLYAGELGDLLASLCGVPKLACSAHGGTAAVALAERLGCDPIVLVGHDFEAADGGLVYPECLDLGTSRTRIAPGGIAYDWDPTLQTQRRHNPLNSGDALVEIERYDGSKTITTGALAGTLRWYEQVSRSMAEDKDPRTLVNASERGARVAGWEPWLLQDVISALNPCEYVVSGAPSVTDEQIDAWIAAHLDGMAEVERSARAGDAKGVMRALRGAPLVEPWCQSRLAAVTERRREDAMLTNPWLERRVARDHESDIMAILLAELPSLMSELNHVAR